MAKAGRLTPRLAFLCDLGSRSGHRSMQVATERGIRLVAVCVTALREILYGSAPAMCLLFSLDFGLISNNIAQL